MRHLYRTAALALVMSATGLAGAQAQDQDEEKASGDIKAEEQIKTEDMNAGEMQSDATQSGTMPSEEANTDGAASGEPQEEEPGSAEMAASGSDHCEREWIVLDGNEDGFISQEEASGGMKTRFDAIDADGNEAITKTEYIDCKTGTGEKAADAGRDDETFKAADADSSGALSRKEYGDAAATAYEEALATDDTLQPFIVLRRYVFLTPVEAEKENALAEMPAGEVAARSLRNFGFLDADDNGEISMSEWRIQTPTVGMTDDAATAQFTELDADGDDEITRAEFEAALAGTSSKEMSGEEVHAANSEGVPVFIWWYE